MNVVIRRFAGAARRLNPRPPESPPSLAIRGDAVAAPPAFPQSPPGAWPQEDCANEPAAFFACGEPNALWALGARAALVLLVFVASLSSRAAVLEVGEIGLTVADPAKLEAFYTNVLPFKVVGRAATAGSRVDAVFGLTNTSLRTTRLQLGEEVISLNQHVGNAGRPIPPDSRSFDHWFQHIAIVVSDMDRAYEHLRRHKVKHVSTAPQTLPAWNKDAGGIKAFYFRDPEDHVLEIIWFPPGKGDPKWQKLISAQTGTGRQDAGAPSLFLGIDHTAIVVSDTDKSLAFYTNALGLRVVGGAENYGTEQEHLNQVFGARLRITALRAGRGPGIEFLEYITPPGGRPLPADAQANDLVFWHTRLVADGLDELAAKLREQQTRFVSARAVSLNGETTSHGLSHFAKCDNSARSLIVRDPDGHALRLIESARSPGNQALTSNANKD